MSLSSPPLARIASTPTMGSQELRPALHEQIAELITRLRSEHDRYERAAESWTDEAAEDKRQARKAREVTLHEIEALPMPYGYRCSIRAWLAPPDHHR